MRCVECGALLNPEEILAAGPFPCPTCQTRLQASDAYARWIGLGNLVFSAVVSRLLGFRSLHLLYAVLVAWLPVQYLALHFLKFVIPPKIELAVPVKSISEILRKGRQDISRIMRERR